MNVMADTRQRVMLVGLGATGVAIGQALAQREDCELVAAIDIDPARRGRDLGEVLGGPAIGVPVVADLDAISATVAGVAVVATTSLLAALEPTVVPLLERGINVVSICEELGYPWVSHPAIADRLDRVAKANGVSILGTGCNPGFLMDTLPLLLSGLTQRVDRVEIRRTADMSGYGAILRKFGLGETIDAFDEAQAMGRVVGHIGFEQAAAALATGLGWELDEIVVDPVRPAFVAPRTRRGVHVEVPAGTVAAVVHSARGYFDGRCLIDLTIHFGIFQPGDPVDPGDRWRIHGEEQLIEVAAEGGFDSFLSTVSVASNVATSLVGAAPGLRTMADLGALGIASKGARRSGSDGRGTEVAGRETGSGGQASEPWTTSSPRDVTES